jgi:hypothetical protein
VLLAQQNTKLRSAILRLCLNGQVLLRAQAWSQCFPRGLNTKAALRGFPRGLNTKAALRGFPRGLNTKAALRGFPLG